ncbi:molybdopterin-guanine dinucleotide biosynthesis protein [Citricoccus sp. I39-566]|uniref:molybdopterin-guanine dinucleotide biosynthesis protein n=1 Tax=Citricoccus sp. I39-566 TaxID=3073268 RepID=UPI00286A5548|nr:molybdopterin-guanine dinucleotide biosynthesis protein [Citricoccus sp. I39-566]WMY79506.1 molybdopterin-guanine dinucleotide biosynthesis protein [Citricoccus sp. I39-566]
MPETLTAELMAALELGDAAVDIPRLARLARIAAATSGNDDDAAATAFIAGYAAGLAEGTGQAGFDRAHRASLHGIERLLDRAVAEDVERNRPAR